METLPEEMVLELTQYLSEWEVAACCAVSRAWRDVFNRDVIWRQRCDAALAEHLRDTKCVVEPGFKSPEVEDSGLSPVCEERLNYMRQVHLYNNWRHSRYKETYKQQEVKSMTFYNDNLLITHHLNFKYTQPLNWTNTVQLWDVQSRPILLSEYLATEYFSELDVCEELIVLKHLGLVLVLTVSNLKLNYRHSFFISEVDNLSSLEQKINERFKISQTVTVGSTEVAISGLPGANRRLNVWNLKTGEKLKEEKYQNLDYLYRKHHCNGRKIAISVQMSKFFQKILVYDVGRLSFTDFSVTLNSPNRHSVAVHEEYIAVDASKHVNIYSLATSQLVRSIPLTGTFCNIDIFGDNFVFNDAGNLKLINMRSLEEHQLVEGLVDKAEVFSQSIIISQESKRYFLPSYYCTSFLPLKSYNLVYLYASHLQCHAINNNNTKIAYYENKNDLYIELYVNTRALCVVFHFW